MSEVLDAFKALIGKLAGLAADHPLGAIVTAAGALVSVFLLVLLSTPVVRTAVRKFFWLTRHALTADRGWRDLIYWFIVSALVALPVALTAGFKSTAGFDWRTFGLVVLIVAVGNALRVLFDIMTETRILLRPIHGVRWRQERKIGTAAVLQRIDKLLRDDAPRAADDVREVLTDLLSLVASNVRDHRGNHRRVDVFANLLIADGQDLVVVARDRNLHSRDLKRDTPQRYTQASLAASRALASRQPIAVGDYRLEYPEAPKNKPYTSILAIPLLPSDGGPPFGVLSIDSTRPYFFESFQPGAVENDLENSLAPYTATIILALEALLSRDRSAMVAALLREPAIRRA